MASDKTFDPHYAQRIRTAWILAKKKYKTLTDEEKLLILNKIKEEE